MVRNLHIHPNLTTGECAMTETIQIDGQVFKLNDLPKEVLDNLELIQIAKEKLEELKLTLNFFNKAREAYRAEVLNEVKNSEPVFTFGID